MVYGKMFDFVILILVSTADKLSCAIPITMYILASGSVLS